MDKDLILDFCEFKEKLFLYLHPVNECFSTIKRYNDNNDKNYRKIQKDRDLSQYFFFFYRSYRFIVLSLIFFSAYLFALNSGRADFIQELHPANESLLISESTHFPD